ncbi:tyrosine-type recombinase/integrase [Pseudomonas sp. B21-036]|uniref:tyrosine-type recombinase/integrase n=1 Tax=unclassified Pseudomonas TaxID=196821 RepID=UPI001E30EB92|nr:MULTISPECIES: tyrosine-type recombinase/integrase [unclassified Pseudomonas]MCQ0168482.1 site-specific integrase [Pseudomonas sp. S12(2018)]UVL48965.1 tyrosine-type recombinase/integrase [Pseudomonas sp. B21-036]
MARKPMDLPRGVEIFRNSLRIRFTWGGIRRCETLPYPPTQKGIQAASQLRDQVVSFNRLGLLDQDKYAELFPGSQTVAGSKPSFGEYAQLWLDSREITPGTRQNYKSALNLYWMPTLALTQVDLISTTTIRRIITSTEWHSPGVKRNALIRLSTILSAALKEGLITKNPAAAVELPKRSRKEIDPFTLDEANQIVEKLYQHAHWPSQIYAAFFEFVFFTGVRLSEGLAMRWDAVDMDKKVAHVRRTVALGEVVERTKTGKDRFVLLNERALRALEFAKNYAERRRNGKGRVIETPFVFPPSKNAEFVQQTSDLHHQWRPVLKDLGIRYRPPYNCRHTYATICLMSGLNPAFISQQLGHSVQMLLSTYARWINSSSDWSELEKLQIGIKSVSAALPAT